MVRNRLRARRGRGAWLLGLGLFAWFFMLVLATLGVTFATLDPLGFGPTHGAAVLAAVITAAVVAALVFDLQHAVSSVLLDSDLELLRRAPLTPRDLLAVKLLDSIPRTAAMILAVALPACLAFVIVVGTPAWGWVLLPILLAGLWAAPLGVGLAGALLILRIVPAARVREVLAVLSTLMMLGLWLLNSFAMPRLLSDETRLAPRLVEGLTPAAWVVALSPPHWAAGALLAAHRGAMLEAAGWTLRLALIGLASLGLAAFAARSLLDDVLARVAAGEGSAARRHPAGATVPAGRITALLLKDARLFTRDWSVLGDVLTAALLWTLLPLIAGPFHQAPPGLLARLMLVALAVGLGYEIGARTVPYEGPALAWSRLAPLSAWRWNGAKWLGGAVIALPLVVIAALVARLALRIGWMEWAQALAAGLGALIFSLALGLWTGWKFGDPNWTNPRAMLTFAGRLIASGLLILQAAAWIGALAAADTLGDSVPPGLLLWGPPALGLALAVATMTGVVRLARRHEWTS